MKHIAVVGNWHNAFVTAACLASFGHHVTLVNHTKTPWDQFPRLDIHEPGLDKLIVDARRQGRIHYTNLVDSPEDFNEVLADVVWLAIDTPLRYDDSPDVEPLIWALGCAQGRFRRAKLFVVGSQVPVGFCQDAEKRMGVPVACVPENMRIGSGVADFLEPERLVIGATDTLTVATIEALLRASAATKIVRCDLPTAEMIKHATNAMLATQISLANELAGIGEQYGVDNGIVAKALRMDRRIGSYAYVRAGLGFSGGTLPRDLRAGRTHDVPSHIVDHVLDVNENVLGRVAGTIMKLLPPAPRTVCLMGYTYKAETDAIRRSPISEIVDRVGRLGRSVVQDGVQQDVNIVGYDPRFNGRYAELETLGIGPGHTPTWECFERKPDLPGGVDVFVVVAALPEFKRLDWSGRGPAVVYDLCGGVDREAVLAAGLGYKLIWQPAERVPA